MTTETGRRHTGRPASVMLRHYLEPLQAELARPDVTDLCINRPGEFWLETFTGWERRGASWLTFDFAFSLAEAIANYNDKSINDADSTLSCELPDGERCEIVIPPSCEAGTVAFALRKGSSRRLTLDELARGGALQNVRRVTSASNPIEPVEEQLLDLYRHDRFEEFIRLAVRSRRTIVFAGSTGSGKTTFLKAWADYIPASERVITCEDVPEISLPHQPNHVHLFYGEAGQSRCNVNAARLIKSVLRMNPSRFLQTELRGPETYEFFDALNTGHPGAMTTTHANSTMDTFDRLAGLVAQSERARNRSYVDIRKMVVQSIDVVVFCEKTTDAAGNEVRRMRDIYYDPEYKRQAGL